jgi:hypothetical protein
VNCGNGLRPASLRRCKRSLSFGKSPRVPAKYEGSALAQLSPFTPDQATLADFTEAFKCFAQCEALRADVLMTRSSSFEVDDPSPHRTWLASHGHEFLELPDDQRLTLARWLPLFRHADSPNNFLCVSTQRMAG